MRVETFGRTEAGEEVAIAAISGGGLTARVMTWGAVLQDLRLQGHDAPLVLGFERFEHYPAHSPYFGAIAGRCANRIANGQFSIDGMAHQADTNFLARHTLHGGRAGIGKRNWNLAESGDDFVELHITDPDGAMGFPGNCEIACRYSITADETLVIVLTATADKPTLCNLAHHSYFNLDGSADCRDHELQIDADAYLPVDGELIPTGEVAAVEATAFDFRQPRNLRWSEGAGPFIYDHNWCTGTGRSPCRPVARLRSGLSGVTMDIESTEPGLQFYAGHKIDIPAAGLDGRRYGAFAGLALEPQVWPDAPNHAHFPSAVLRPGETYRQESRFRFSK